MPQPSPHIIKLLTLLAACAGSLAVGAVDVATGAEIHVVSLYFLPLFLAGWRLTQAGAVWVALFTTVAWMVALYANGARHMQPYVWVVNFVTQGSAFLIVALLVARLRLKFAQEQALRRIDVLSGLNNRQGFIERAGLMLPLCRRHARCVSLAFIDLDNFKQANDTRGHAYGDLLLQRCGAIIAHSLRNSDVAARLGGDEFAVLLPETSRDQALEVCRRLLHELRNCSEFRLAGVTASIGVVADEGARHDIADLLRLADAEMYRAKHGGRNAVTAVSTVTASTAGVASPAG